MGFLLLSNGMPIICRYPSLINNSEILIACGSGKTVFLVNDFIFCLLLSSFPPLRLIGWASLLRVVVCTDWDLAVAVVY